MKSKFLSINAKDLLEGFILATISGMGTALYEALSVTPFVFNLETLKHSLTAGLVVGIGWLVNKFPRNSEGKLLKKEPVQKN